MSDDNDIELKRLRMERIQKLMQEKKKLEDAQNQHVPTLAEKIDRLLAVLLDVNAAQYLVNVKQRDIKLYNEIRQRLFPPELIAEVDMLLSYLQRGMIRRGVIGQTEVQQIERQVLGIGPKITIKKQGQDAQTLGSFLKDEED